MGPAITALNRTPMAVRDTADHTWLSSSSPGTTTATNITGKNSLQDGDGPPHLGGNMRGFMGGDMEGSGLYRTLKSPRHPVWEYLSSRLSGVTRQSNRPRATPGIPGVHRVLVRVSMAIAARSLRLT